MFAETLQAQGQKLHCVIYLMMLGVGPSSQAGLSLLNQSKQPNGEITETIMRRLEAADIA